MEAFLVSFGNCVKSERFTGEEAAQAGEATPRGAGEAPQLPAAEAEPRMAKREEPGEPPEMTSF